MPSNIFNLGDIFASFTIVSLVDVTITAALIYIAIGWIQGTQALQVAKGILVLVLIALISNLFGFVTLNYALTNVMTVGFIAIVIIFQPELRRALDKLGRVSILPAFLRGSDAMTYQVIAEILEAVREMSNSKTGAIIVIERDSRLSDIIDTGTRLDARVSHNLLGNIFFPNSPLHDGAVVISRQDLLISAAGCLLPLTQNTSLNRQIGTRHRAALGISENSDCVAVVVSEETGTISYAIDGRLSRFADLISIETVLKETMIATEKWRFANLNAGNRAS